ncbi:acyl-CoA transferase [Pseudorhodobacter sp.]|uniref:acyl-CoA transferase n=1 Tax=Pseudorhodobacter sp. TaxID=1934400 RepID=UPI002AFE519C|nr:acyl-CoA transferase [Pseudorhodobacter sp.]
MPSKSEAVLQALHSALVGRMPYGAKVLRNAVLPERVPAAGVMILRDGNPGTPEALMSPPLYVYEHRAEIDVLVEGTEAAREAAFDALKLAIHAAIAADRTFGGLCDYAIGEAPAPINLAIEGAEGFKAATIPVVLTYGTADPLL